MTKDDSLYLEHILSAMGKIEYYTRKRDGKVFMANTLLQDAVIRQIEIIGEATKLISQQLKAKYPHIPWKDIAGMRDKLIHGYFGVDIEAVWATVRKDIPSLKKDIESIVANLKAKKNRL